MDTTLIKIDNPGRLSVLVMCCDDPQHTYLIESMIKHCNVVGIVIETNRSQMDWLWQKGRYRLWLYRKYHSCRRQLVGDAKHRQKYFQTDFSVSSIHNSLLYVSNINNESVKVFLQKKKPDVTICAGTMYIGRKIISSCKFIINLHNGILPFYKGNQCIFFALYEKEFDKIGATIHLITEQLDGGPVIDFAKPVIDTTDNDESLYCKSFKAGVRKLIEILNLLQNNGEIYATPQNISTKKAYSHCDRNIFVELSFFLKRKRDQYLDKRDTPLPH